MARVNSHHINYETDWSVDLTRQMHTVIGTIQNTKGTVEQYAILTNFVHSLVAEWNRVRMELDVGGDHRLDRFKNRKARGDK